MTADWCLGCTSCLDARAADRSHAARRGAFQMRSVRLRLRVRPFLLAASVLLIPPASRAQTTDVSGSYQCVQVKIKGKAQPCTAAPLILKHDGRFELRGWEGKYEVSGQWVELSDSLLKTRVKIEPGHKIVLRYYGKQGLVEIFYERRRAELGKTLLG